MSQISPTPADRFMDILLQEAHTPSDLEPVLQKVFSDLRSQHVTCATAIAASPRSIHRRWVSAIATLLAACLVIGVLAMWPAASSATDVLEKVVQSTEAQVDREYLFEMTGPIKTRATLWVNGGDRFVLKLRALLPVGDEYIWLGCNGSEFWIVPTIGPVLVDRRPGWLLDQLRQRHQLALPILHLSSVTRRLQSRYRPPTLLPHKSGREHLMTEQKLPYTELLPQRVEIIAHQRVIHQLDLSWPHYVTGVTPLQMNLSLQHQNPMPSDWYDHIAHHHASRRVLPDQENAQP